MTEQPDETPKASDHFADYSPELVIPPAVRARLIAEGKLPPPESDS